jgi:hypothetical protein
LRAGLKRLLHLLLSRNRSVRCRLLSRLELSLVVRDGKVVPRGVEVRLRCGKLGGGLAWRNRAVPACARESCSRSERVLVRRRVRLREKRDLVSTEASKPSTKLLHASAREDTERASLMLVVVLRRRAAESLERLFAECGDAGEREVRDAWEGLEHLVDGGDGEVVAVRQVDALERVAVSQRLDSGVRDVVDLREEAE